eukprot:5703297-Pyramimonas_sp.AAC.1
MDREQMRQEQLAGKDYARWSRTQGKWVDELETSDDEEEQGGEEGKPDTQPNATSSDARPDPMA